MTTAAASTPAPSKCGPNTPQGKARSSMNAQRHGLRARTFGILPGEEQAEWALHLAELQAGYGPVDDTELKLVEAIAAAMWNEIRADRTLAEVLVAIPPLAPGRPHGGDLQEPGHALSLNTAPRYLTAAGMATQRTQRAFLAHRKARQAGLILPERPQADPANENRTNENTPEPDRPRVPPNPAEPNPPNCTNELPRPSQPRPVPAPLTPLRARLDRLLDGSDPRSLEEWDLVEAIRVAKLPGAAPYGGVI